ncbi:MAG: class I SAM-dependent methyltransferase [Thermoplasmata archaeon]
MSGTPERREAPLPAGTPPPTASPRTASERSVLELRVAEESPVPLLFVEEGGKAFVVLGEAPGAWFSGAVREGACEARWPDGRVSGCSTELVTDPLAMQRIRRLFDAKYGPAVWNRYFDGRKEALEIDPRRRRRSPSVGDRARGEFDAVASGYSANLSRHPIDRYLKDRVVGLSLEALAGLDPILEIGPGTGYHTLPLLASGHRVLAVDISERMLRELRTNADRLGVGDRLSTRRAGFGELRLALADLPEGHFSAGFSAFGAFNLEPDSATTGSTLTRLIRPGGRLVFTSLNRPGVVPVLWELALARPAAAGYRMRTRVPAGRVRYPLELYPRSPQDWDEVLTEGFTRESALPVSVLAPPFDSERIARFLGPRGGERMRRWDSFLAQRTNAWMAAEWVFLAYTRKPPPSRSR